MSFPKLTCRFLEQREKEQREKEQREKEAKEREQREKEVKEKGNYRLRKTRLLSFQEQREKEAKEKEQREKETGIFATFSLSLIIPAKVGSDKDDKSKWAPEFVIQKSYVFHLFLKLTHFNSGSPEDQIRSWIEAVSGTLFQ